MSNESTARTSPIILDWEIGEEEENILTVRDGAGDIVLDCIPYIFRSTLEHAVEAVNSTGWQPIETAPRDGTAFLGIQQGEYKPGVPYIPIVIAFRNGYFRDADETRSQTHPWSPTHWMPLPPPPEAP